jgi:hydrogenase-4 membrane subunit HyfE
MTRAPYMIAPLALLAWAFTLGLVSATFAYLALGIAVPVIALVFVERHLARNARNDAAGDDTDEQDGPLGDLIALPKDFCLFHAGDNDRA